MNLDENALSHVIAGEVKRQGFIGTVAVEIGIVAPKKPAVETRSGPPECPGCPVCSGSEKAQAPRPQRSVREVLGLSDDVPESSVVHVLRANLRRLQVLEERERESNALLANLMGI